MRHDDRQRQGQVTLPKRVLYRERRGAKTGVLPGFFIGAHAAVAGASLPTHDPARVRAYFPAVDLIAP